jgi:serine/threonine protein kinase
MAASSAAPPEDLFTRLERIGRGSFGEVYKGIDNRTAEVLLQFSFRFFFSHSHELYSGGRHKNH